jgi:hypothetical protein
LRDGQFQFLRQRGREGVFFLAECLAKLGPVADKGRFVKISALGVANERSGVGADTFDRLAAAVNFLDEKSWCKILWHSCAPFLRETPGVPRHHRALVGRVTCSI